jgi:hypothetical protein
LPKPSRLKANSNTDTPGRPSGVSAVLTVPEIEASASQAITLVA